MQVGTVQLVNADRGFGFVRPDGASGDVFFHFRALKGGLVCNETLRGPARRVRRGGFRQRAAREVGLSAGRVGRKRR